MCQQEKIVYHGEYSLRRKVLEDVPGHYIHLTYYDGGEIAEIESDDMLQTVLVRFRNGEEAKWESELFSSYINSQFGIAVSGDGNCVFAQTWDRGLYCMDSRSGKRIWRTQSKKGITSLFVNRDTLLCHQRGCALQLLDVRSGEVLKEKRPARDWGFVSIDHSSIVCRVSAKRWELIRVSDLDTLASYTHSQFTGGHEDFVVNSIIKCDGALKISGFKNVWDNSEGKPKLLPNLEFEHWLQLELP